MRKKFVCFNCRYIWKSKETKHERTTDEYVKWLEQHYEKNNYCRKEPACSKCGQPGIQVGRNFRHCKNEKEWKKLIQKYKDGKIDMMLDFYFDPKETNPKIVPPYGSGS
jgi:hypothetical protein